MRHKNYLELKDSVQVQNALANCTPKFKLFWRWRNHLAVLGLCLSASVAFANQLEIVGPPSSGKFGDKVTVLPNGNFVVTDPNFDLSNPTVVDVGAVYLYAPDGVMISQLTGSNTNERVGLDRVQLLTNGNYVVTDPSFDLSNPTVVDVGAVYLYTADGVMISQLTGSNTNDRVGLEPVQLLTNGNFILKSYGPNGSCAVTWASATQGVNGVVSPTNSLIGNGGRISVTVLNNGNYVVLNPTWGNGAIQRAGAITWGNGLGGTVGEISAANSLVGGHLDHVGEEPLDRTSAITVLSNNNYVVRSMRWGGTSGEFPNDFGAVTWGNGTGGTIGVISAANSFVGASRNDHIGNGDITALSNGNYVVSSNEWDTPGATSIYNAGAVTWGNGATGSSGVISANNSLVGSSFDDQIGARELGVNFEAQDTITALSNGNYVVVSPNWDTVNPPLINVGAVTWGNGASGTTGEITANNSYIGATALDRLGYGNLNFDAHFHGATALENGNYVFGSTFYHSAAGQVVGAVTWGNGASGSSGVVSSANSLVGSTNSDQVGYLAITPLVNGNYVVRTPGWDAVAPAVEDVGAATWGNGATGTTGIISAANSLVGSQTSDNVGGYIYALSNGNYVLRNLDWDSSTPTTSDVGAVTWGNGMGGTIGAISKANSLVGSSASDSVGLVVPLANGNYIVSSYDWAATLPDLVNVGAVTWGNGLGGTVGKVSAANSLVGSRADDSVGNFYPLSNGNYVVASPGWDNGAAVDAGAVAWGNGSTGTKGVLSAANSLVGGSTNDRIGGGSSISVLANGNYVVSSFQWDFAAIDAGAATWGNGLGGTVGAISASNSLIGSSANDGVGFAAVVSDDSYAVITSGWDNAVITNAGAVSLGGPLGLRGQINAGNSVLGTVADGGAFFSVAYDKSRKHLVVGRSAANTVTIFGDQAGSLFANGFE